MTDVGRIPTWQDFPEFYNNPVIQRLAPNQKWTVSTTKSMDPKKKTKMPIDMYALMYENQVWGASFDRGHNPYVDLKTLCEVIPSATNNAYALDALEDKYVVLDVEPKCPENLKKSFLELPYLYAERSMSGEGLHLIFDLPENILNKYPNAQVKTALTDENGYYEILLCHMITFTRNALPPAPNLYDVSVFHNIFEIRAMTAKPAVTAETIITDIDPSEVPYNDEIVSYLDNNEYPKNLADFPKKGTATGYDASAYEFGMAGFYYRALKRLLDNDKYKDHTYSDEEKAVIIYQLISENLPYRPKHDQSRNGMPWLLSVATNLVAKSEVNN